VPIVHGLEAKYSGKVRFVYLDIDDPDTTPFKRELGYRVQPHLFLLDGSGKIVEQWLGRVTADDLEPALEQIAQ
jgi:hypothetical protein